MGIPYANSETTDRTNADRSQREDLIDLIYNLSPTETPFLQMADRGTCSATKYEWQMDALAAAADNATDEGLHVANAEISAFVATERCANYTQIWQKSISISGTMEVVNKAGRNSELSYQLAKRAKELKRDMEFTMVGNDTVANTLGVAASPRRSAAVQAQFHTQWTTTYGTNLEGANISRDATSGADGGWNGTVFLAPTDSSAVRPLLESDLKGVIQGAWTNGGDPTIVMVGPFNKTVISTFTGGSTRFDRGEDKRLVAAIDVYVSDFGEHRVVPNRFQRGRDCLVLTPELFTVCYLRPFRQHALSKIGDTEERTLLCEATLKLANNAGSGIVADLTTS
jgi:hypothetical protein